MVLKKKLLKKIVLELRAPLSALSLGPKSMRSKIVEVLLVALGEAWGMGGSYC